MPWDPGWDAGEEYDRAGFIGGGLILIIGVTLFILFC